MAQKTNQIKPIYLDAAATTPVYPEVVESMLPFFTEHFGNPSSAHVMGWYGKGAISRARKQVADAIGADEQEITFTSGATESINIAIQGVFERYQVKGKEIITAPTEHKAVLEPIKALEKKGAIVKYLPVDSNGVITPQALENAISDKTILIALMWVNNETGLIQDIPTLSKIAGEKRIPFLCDATQAIGKVPIDVLKTGIGLLALSGHKFGAPKGVGALFVRRKSPRISVSPVFFGGGQENHLRPGTLNTPSIVGMGNAIEKSCLEMDDNLEKWENLKLEWLNFCKNYGGSENINGPTSPHILNVQIPQIRAHEFIKKAQNICLSVGSACTSETLDPSHVLTALGLSKNACFSSLRISFGWHSSLEETKEAQNVFMEILTT